MTASSSSSYTANNLNQYSQRTVPGVLLINGSAVTGATVMIRQDTNTVAQAASRHEEYFWKEFAVANDAGVYSTTNIEVRAVMTQGTNSLVRFEKKAAILPKSPEQFSYDLDGNLTRDGRWTNTWNGENRLITTESLATVPDSMKKKLEFKYDYMGRRTEKKVYTYNSGSWILTTDSFFVYDGWNCIAELGSGYTNYMTWGQDLSGSLQGAGGVGGLVFISLNGTNCIPMFDGNGNVMGLVNAADGTLVAEYEYGVFGETLKAMGVLAGANRFRFSTKQWDVEIETYSYIFRDYIPRLARWGSRDPAEEMGGYNLYGFVGNDGANYFDYLGLWIRDAWSGKRGKYEGHACRENGDTLRSLAKMITGNEMDALLIKVDFENALHVDISALLAKLESTLRVNVVSATDKFKPPFSKRFANGQDGEGDINKKFEDTYNGGGYECWSAATMILAKGLIDTLKAGEFNALGYRLSSIGNIAGANVLLGGLMEVSAVKSQNEMLNGDWAYIQNWRNYNGQLGNWSGENVIKVGDDKYWGHGGGGKSYQDWVTHLQNQPFTGSGDKGDFVGFRGDVNQFLNVSRIGMDVFDLRKGQK